MDDEHTATTPLQWAPDCLDAIDWAVVDLAVALPQPDGGEWGEAETLIQRLARWAHYGMAAQGHSLT